MIEIKDLLNKLNNILLSNEGKKNSIAEAIFEVVGVKINPKKIEIKNNIVYLDVKPIYKNEIFLKQEQIFSKLKEIFGKNTPPKIR